MNPPEIEDTIEDCLDLFNEPSDFRPPPPPGQEKLFKRTNGGEIKLKLVGKHSLWAHWLWNAVSCCLVLSQGMSMANYIDANPELVKGKSILELGAASALPSIVCCMNNAAVSVITDFPDPELIQTIEANVSSNLDPNCSTDVLIKGYQWGMDASDILSLGRFDVILMADLIFNHTEHLHLLESSKNTLKPSGCILVFFTHHVVKWADRDLKFFEIAKDLGFTVEKISQEKWFCMFPEDDGDETIRSTVHSYKLTL